MKPSLQKWASAAPAWLGGAGLAGDGIVISSRVRIARNLADSPFPHAATHVQHRKNMSRCLEAAKTLSCLKDAYTLDMAKTPELERQFFVERHLASHGHAGAAVPRSLLIGVGEGVSFMLNEEDHVRAAVFEPGLALEAAWGRMDAIDDELGDRLPVAFDRSVGFLTACPTNIGAGLRASCLLHLPALVLRGQIDALVQKLVQGGFVIRGFYGEGTNAVGDLFQISNGPSLGKTEPQILRDVERAVRSAVALEHKAQAALDHGSEKVRLHDRVGRALGTLQRAHVLSFDEAARCLSWVRLGVRAGFPHGLGLEVVTRPLFLTQPAHLQLRLDAGEAAVPVLRAREIRHLTEKWA